MHHFFIYPVNKCKKYGSSLSGLLLIGLSSIPYLMNYEALFHLLHTTDFVLHTDFTTSTSFFDSPKDFVSKLSASDSNTHPLSTE